MPVVTYDMTQACIHINNSANKNVYQIISTFDFSNIRKMSTFIGSHKMYIVLTFIGSHKMNIVLTLNGKIRAQL